MGEIERHRILQAGNHAAGQFSGLGAFHDAVIESAGQRQDVADFYLVVNDDRFAGERAHGDDRRQFTDGKKRRKAVLQTETADVGQHDTAERIGWNSQEGKRPAHVEYPPLDEFEKGTTERPGNAGDDVLGGEGAAFLSGALALGRLFNLLGNLGRGEFLALFQHHTGHVGARDIDGDKNVRVRAVHHFSAAHETVDVRDVFE